MNTKKLLSSTVAGSCAALFWTIALTQSSYSQVVGTSTSAPKATTGVVVDAPYVLADSLVRELRNGGFVLYIRHGTTLANTSDKRGPGAWWQDCDKTARLDATAQPQIRAIADALVRQRIIVFELYSSEFCRAVETAVQFGTIAARRTSALNDAAALPDTQPETLTRYSAGIQFLLSDKTPPKVNRVLVGHALPPNIVHPALANLPESNVAVFKAEGDGRFHFVTSLSPGQWQWLGRQSVPDQPAISATQSIVGSPQVAPAIPALPTQVLIAPGKELKGVPLVQALRRGGFNLYMRHAQATVGQDGNLLQTPFWWENCAIQRNMSDPGREQARKVGEAIKTLKIPVDQVLTAQFCRTRETGHLLGLGPVEITEDINHQIAQRAGVDVNTTRFKRLAETPAKGMNNILVSHTHGSPRVEERIMGGIQEAEIVVYQPDGKGGSEPVARIPVAEWDNLIKTMAAVKS